MKTLVFACSVLALAACGGSSGICSQLQSTSSYAASTLATCTGATISYNATTCSADVGSCTSSDQTTITNALNCVTNLTAATCTGPSFDACLSSIGTVSAACQEALGGQATTTTATNSSGTTSSSSATTTGTSATATNGSTTNGTSATNATATNGATTSGSGTSATNATATNGATTSGTSAITGTATATSGTATATSSSTSGSSGTSGIACTVNTSTGADPCTADSLECSDQTGMAGTCVLPYEFATCGNPGCAIDGGYALSCIELEFMNPADGGVIDMNQCLETCTSTSACADPLTNCQNATTGMPGICYYNFCDPSQANYSACDAGASNDGQCYPFPNGSSTIDFCVQTGSIASYATCTEGEAPTGLARGSLCEANNFCLSADGTNTYCFPYCDTGDTTGAQSCTSPATCNSLMYSTWGICLTQCPASTCPANTTCDTADSFCE